MKTEREVLEHAADLLRKSIPALREAQRVTEDADIRVWAIAVERIVGHLDDMGEEGGP